jgi:hypothetical protein
MICRISCDICNALSCQPACLNDDDCHGLVCLPPGRCARPACRSDGDCAPDLTCYGGNCMHKDCRSDADCRGYCVERQCYDVFGTCAAPL